MAEHLRRELRVAREAALSRLAARMPGLAADDWTALGGVPAVHWFIGRGRRLLGEGEKVTHLGILCKGWALRQSRLDQERRQILGLFLPGDLVGLHVDGDNCATCEVEALTACEVGEIDVVRLDAAAAGHPAIAKGLCQARTRELARSEDDILRLGRMTAYERVCSFLLEIYRRQRELNPTRRSVDFPVSQTLLADALGLSVVHVNRQIMQLRREGAVTLDRRHLTVHDEHRLATIGGFHDRHFGMAGQVMQRAS